MNRSDDTAIEPHLLRVFLAVIETGAVTAAADRLGLTQSAASHALKRLAGAIGEPLFVRAGRGIAATDRALALAPRARDILAAMRAFARPATFDPAEARIALTVAANDLQRDLVLPALYRHLSHRCREIRLRVIPSEIPSAELLRRQAADLVLTPLPPDGSDILQRQLFTDHYVCFYDAAARAAPRTRASYLAARHATVVYPDDGRLQLDKDLERIGIRRTIAVAAPSFAGVSAFVAGSDLIASVPSRLAGHAMRGLAHCRLPLGADRRLVPQLAMYLVWHRRSHTDPAHAFVRGLIVDIVKRTGDGVALSTSVTAT
ncbi:MAG: LysR family transcriptional regulator [Hyphomicrobiaceae bacterium]